MPISRPELSSSGPPELPGLMAASVWMTPLIGRLLGRGDLAPEALTMPVVSVWSRPKGLPMAKVLWPTCKSCDVPMGIGTSFDCGASIVTTAMSLSG